MTIVTPQQVSKGVSLFIENEIARKATGLTQFAVYFILPNIYTKVENMLKEWGNNDLTKGFFNETGNVDLDKVHEAAKTAIQKSGQFEYQGIIFNDTDVEKLYTYIKSANNM